MGKGRLDALRGRVRRLQLVMGVGFAAVVLGAVVSASLVGPARSLIEKSGSRALAVILGTVVPGLWVLLVLPALGYLTGRVAEIRPAGFAIGAALTGEAFLVALETVTDVLSGTASQAETLVLRVLVLAAGTALTAWAVHRARRSGGPAATKASVLSEENRAAYDEMQRPGEDPPWTRE